MSQNKERWFGGIILLGGGALLSALLLQGKGENALTTPVTEAPVYGAMAPEDQAGNTPPAVTSTTPSTTPNTQTPEFRPLALDVETEKRMLEIKRAEREKQVAEQEAKTAAFLAQQQQLEAESAKMAADEQARKLAKAKSTLANNEDIAPVQTDTPADTASTPTPDNKDKEKQAAAKALEAQRIADAKIAKAKQDAQAAAASALKSKEDAKKANLAAKAEAEKQHQAYLKHQTQLAADAKQAKADAEKQAAADQKLAAQKATLELQKQHQKQADDKAAALRKEEAARLDALVKQKAVDDAPAKGDKAWMVQVALSASPDATDSLVSKLRAKGYKVVTSKTTKGTRVLVGPQKSKELSAQINSKIAGDDSLNVKGSWVINWQPLTQ